MQYLYLIECQRFYKIGIANDVQNRLAQLSTGNPFELKLLITYAFENANAVEAAIHQRFANARKRGEWFELCNDDLITFSKICQLLGGVPSEEVPTVAKEEDIEEAEVLAEPTEGAKFDYAAMFADGWRMERANDGERNGYWRWAKGSGSERKHIYGGRIEDLPYTLSDMRLVFRDKAEPLNPPKKLAESVGNGS